MIPSGGPRSCSGCPATGAAGLSPSRPPSPPDLHLANPISRQQNNGTKAAVRANYTLSKSSGRRLHEADRRALPGSDREQDRPARSQGLGEGAREGALGVCGSPTSTVPLLLGSPKWFEIRSLPHQNLCSLPLGTQYRAVLPRARAIPAWHHGQGLLSAETGKTLPGHLGQLAAPAAPCQVSCHPQSRAWVVIKGLMFHYRSGGTLTNSEFLPWCRGSTLGCPVGTQQGHGWGFHPWDKRVWQPLSAFPTPPRHGKSPPVSSRLP